MTTGEIILLTLGILILVVSLVLCAIAIYIAFALKKQKAPSVDIAPIKEVVDLKIGQIEGTNKLFINEINSKIQQLEKEMKTLNEQNTKNYIDMMEKLNTAINQMSKATREENEKAIENLNKKFDEFSKNMTENYKLIDNAVAKSLSELRRENSEKLESIQKTVGEKLDGVQKTVDEKLQKTIDERLKESFENVVSQIGNVNKAIGEIKGIATDVGSLKNVLTNVKTKGIVGEVILGNIISEILTKDQYEENVVTKKGSRDPVEFAIKMPSSDDEYIYLPIDSKFPLETYYKIKDAIDAGDKVALELARKELRAKIRAFAKDISTKYIDPPNTTDFAIMFLPTEGLYIEVIEAGLFEECQREFKVNMAGPTTLSALLNALKQGFKSLAIQKKSADVFKLLEAVKTEFETFADALTKTKRHVEQVDADLANLIGTRTNVMSRKLKTIGTMSGEEAREILEIE
ncbi:MAG: DNA recombination protein RmuC [Clostridia bacterium]|nr:DNA recombination protein RmuC [Clostridia bacterium]